MPGVLLQPTGVTRDHLLGLSALLNVPLVRCCCWQRQGLGVEECKPRV